MVPYEYLSLDIKIPNWKSKIKDFDQRQMHFDRGCSLIDSESKKIFSDLGLIPYYGMLWSWVSSDNINETNYHIDTAPSSLILTLFSVNILLDGTPALTEWVDESKCEEIIDSGRDPVYNTTHRIFKPDVMPDYSASINNFPMLIRVDIPHRVRRDLIRSTRWTYSMRFVSKQMKSISFVEAKELLNMCIIRESSSFASQ